MRSTTAMARRIIKLLADRNESISTAESCTGGWIAKTLTDIPGCSAVFYGSCVTYTNEVKETLLGVDPAILARDTEVSSACAVAMAQNVREKLGTDVGVSTTGFAGPGGGTDKDPVGTVYIAVSTDQGTVCERFTVPPEHPRAQVRTAAVRRALELIWRELSGEEV